MPQPKLPGAPRLYLIDGYALIYRAFFAMLSRPLRTVRGENTSAAWGIANFLDRLLRKREVEYMAWVHDSGMSFRQEEYPEYKATREKLTNELQADFSRGMERIEQLLTAYGVHCVTVPGYEADDVIGTLAEQATKQDVNVVIVSGDKDFHQLVRRGVWLLNPGRGGPAGVDEHWVGLENSTERLGVAPERVTDLLALVGDTSDNIPGVPGIGEKTAQELIGTFGPLEEILAHASEVTKKRPREALLAHIDNARLSKRLVTIRNDVPVALELETLQTREPDAVSLRQLFHELEFTTLVKTIDTLVATGNGARAQPTVGSKTSYKVVSQPAELDALVRRIREAGAMTFAIETAPSDRTATSGELLRARLVGIAVALAPGEAYYLPLQHRPYQEEQGDLLSPGPSRVAPDRALSGESIAAVKLREGTHAIENLPGIDSPSLGAFRAVLEDETIQKTAQNAKLDLLVLRRHGITLRGVVFDTMLASYVLDPARRSHALEILAMEFLGRTAPTYEQLCGKGQTQLPFDVVPIDCARDFSCANVDITLQLRSVMEEQLVAHELYDLFRDIELALISVLAEMEWTGITIDVPWFQSLKERFQRERKRAEESIWEEAGERFNINSNQQLRVILFDKLGLPVRKRTPTGPSTDVSVLQELADEGHRLPTLLMEYRELSKLESTYLDTLPALVHPEDGRLHTSYNQTVAATGRLSSSDPNLQNIPVRRELGRDIRRGFIPRSGWQMLAADYSQIELRLLAHLSQDEAFLYAFQHGIDIHRQTAAIIFGLEPNDVTPDMRARAKTINFATIYGQGPHALSRQLKLTHAEAREFIDKYFERFTGVRSYLDRMVAVAREQGYVETIFKRRRYIPELRDRNFNIRAFGERVATNAPIQGSAADLIKLAMIRVHQTLGERKLQSKLLLQVHDELVFECPSGELEEMEALIRGEMEHAAALAVPLVVDVGIGANWLDAKAA
ncbi:MAG TPA: DNA polymerase I [Gemmatimonadaceae bacterium]|nr:DNA polymerase I [Gemmatimonadaceae bacterium]